MDGLIELLNVKRSKAEKLYELSCEIQKLCSRLGEMDFAHFEKLVDNKLEITKDIDSLNSRLCEISGDIRGFSGYARLLDEIKQILLKIDEIDKQNILYLSKVLYEHKVCLQDIPI